MQVIKAKNYVLTSQLLISKLRHVNKNFDLKNKLDYVALIDTTIKAEDKIKIKT